MQSAALGESCSVFKQLMNAGTWPSRAAAQRNRLDPKYVAFMEPIRTIAINRGIKKARGPIVLWAKDCWGKFK